MKKSRTILIVVILVVLLGGLLVSTYNGLVTKEEDVTSSLSNLDVYLQRRADLIPNLVNTVKGYMNHETEIIENITNARAKLVGASSIEEKSAANDSLTSAIDALMVVVENYPDLKSSENFMQLSDELSGTENRIATARRDYNQAVKTYNTAIKRFPANMLAGFLGFEKASYFEADESSKEVPNVSFE